MRIVFIGTSKISVNTARSLIEEGHEVIFIERDKERIEELSDELDCGFVHGDGSSPSILEEVGPEETNVLFCMTGSDKDNIIAGLVGRSLDFDKTIIKIEDFSYEHICAELGLENVIVPTRTISRHLTDLVMERDASDLQNVLKEQARFFTFVAGEKEENVTVADLDLTDKAQVICYYRKDEFNLATGDTSLKEDDEVIILCHKDSVDTLRERWPKKEDS